MIITIIFSFRQVSNYFSRNNYTNGLFFSSNNIYDCCKLLKDRAPYFSCLAETPLSLNIANITILVWINEPCLGKCGRRFRTRVCTKSNRQRYRKRQHWPLNHSSFVLHKTDTCIGFCIGPTRSNSPFLKLSL